MKMLLLAAPLAMITPAAMGAIIHFCPVQTMSNPLGHGLYWADFQVRPLRDRIFSREEAILARYPLPRSIIAMTTGILTLLDRPRCQRASRNLNGEGKVLFPAWGGRPLPTAG